jgi:hypothetical protein
MKKGILLSKRKMIKLVKEQRKEDKDRVSSFDLIKNFLMWFWYIFLRKIGFEHKPLDVAVPLAICLKQKGKLFI